MTSFPRLIIQAATAGGFSVTIGYIEGHSGYLDTASRLIALNPEASDDQIEAELGDQLRALVRTGRVPSEQPAPTVRPPLALVHSVDEAERPLHPPDADPPDSFDPRVVG